jgi:hypothetical protein
MRKKTRPPQLGERRSSAQRDADEQAARAAGKKLRPSRTKQQLTPDEQAQLAAERQASREEWPHVQEYLYRLCQTIPEPPQTIGRPPLPLRDMVFCLVCKVFLRQPARRLGSHLREALKCGYVTSLPLSENSYGHHLGRARLTPILEALIGCSGRPMRGQEYDFAIDSTKLYSHQYYCAENKKTKQMVETYDWLRLHALCGVRTGIITAARATSMKISEQRCFEHLVNATRAEGFKLKVVYGDRNYSSHKNVVWLTDLGIDPRLYFKDNARMGKDKSEVWNQKLLRHRAHDPQYEAEQHDREAIERAFRVIKKRFDHRVASMNLTAQCNEALLKALCYNLSVLNRYAHRGLKVEW